MSLEQIARQTTSLTMAEKEQLKEFAKFSKALTSSMPSRMARGEETASSMHPDKFLYKAANYQRQRKQKKVAAAKFKLPPFQPSPYESYNLIYIGVNSVLSQVQLLLISPIE